MEKSIAIHTDPLFVGLTRVPTVGGGPYAAFVLEVTIGMLINIVMGNILYAAVIVPMHGVFYLITEKDVGIFAEIGIWIKTSGNCLNRGFWDAASFSPLPTRKWKL